MWEIHTEQPEEQNQNSPEELYFKDMIKEKKNTTLSHHSSHEITVE